jgi:superfamily II DNA or RNA helicase
MAQEPLDEMSDQEFLTQEALRDGFAMFSGDAPEEEFIQEPDEPYNDDLVPEFVEVDLLPIIPASEEFGGTFKMRDYQREGVDGFYREIQEHRSTMVIWATGLGKTIVMAEIAALWPRESGRILFLAHRRGLVQQAADKISKHICEEVETEMGSQSEIRNGRNIFRKSKVLVGSVQTMCRTNRLLPFDPQQFGLVVIDEAHHATSDTFKKIIAYFQQNRQCRFCGITATPDRFDKVELGEIFESVAHKMDILDGIDQGYLVPLTQKFITIEGLDFANVRKLAKDLNEGDLERAMMGASAEELGTDDEELTPDQIEARQRVEKMLHAFADPTIKEAAGRPGIVFCVTIDHAEKMAAVMRRYGVTAETITQKTPDDERKEINERFQNGRLQFLVGVGVFTEGYDAPRAAVIAMMRPTKSRALATQMVGRGTRVEEGCIEGKETVEERIAAIAASGKPYTTVLDFVGNSGRHKLICTADILGDAYPDDLREYVVAMMKARGVEQDVRKALEEEQERRDRMAKLKAEEDERQRLEKERRYLEHLDRIREEKKLQNIKANVRYSTTEVDPFGVAPVYQEDVEGFRGGCSEKQIKYLVALGVKQETAMSYKSKQAGAIIDSLKSKTGSQYRIFFGKHKGKSLAQAGNGFIWWVHNQMGDGPLKKELIENIKLMKEEPQQLNQGERND